jgi:hypothetical protein
MREVAKVDKAVSSLQRQIDWADAEVEASAECYEIGMQYSERREFEVSPAALQPSEEKKDDTS